MNKDKYLALLWMVCLVISCGIEMLMQEYSGIYGLGIISIIYLAVSMLHDMFLTKRK